MVRKILLAFGIVGFVLLQYSFKTSNPPVQTKSETSKVYKTKYAVVFVIDGPRYTETFGDSTCSLIPRMGKELVKEGVLYTNFMNNGVTHTTPGHVAIMTGVYQSIKNDGSHLPKNPSFMQYYLKEKNAKQAETWIISSKGRLYVLGNTKDKNWKNKYLPTTYCGLNGNAKDYVGDPSTWEKITQVFSLSAPKLTMINLLEVDVNGHQNNWEGYKKGIQNCDEYVYQFWKMIQSHPEMKDKTTLFVTNDHGRHLDGKKDGFVSHGDKCEGCKHLSLLVLGPDTKKDVKIEKEGELIDISKTISEMFDFCMPTGKGRFLSEMFLDQQ